MTTHATTAIRELSAQELDQVTGGSSFTEGMSPAEQGMALFTLSILGACVCTAVAALIDWLFD